MTREVKIGMAVAGSFLSLVGIVVGTKLYNGDIPPQPTGNDVVAQGSGPAKQQAPPKPTNLEDGPPKFLQISATENAKPLGNQPPEFPPPPPVPSDNGFPSLPPLPGASGVPLPTASDPPFPAANSRKGPAELLNDTIRAQEQNLTNVFDKSRKEIGNAGNGFQLEPKSASPETRLPAVPPVEVAQGTIIDSGVKKQAAPSDPPTFPPLPPAANGNAPPTAPTAIQFLPKKETSPPPVNFGPDFPPKNGPPPAGTELFPPGGVTPVPPLASPTPPSPPLPSTIITPKSAEAPPAFNPQTNTPNNTSPPAASQPGNPFGPASPNQAPPPPPFGTAPNPPGFNPTPPAPTAPTPFNGVPQPPDPFAPQPPATFAPSAPPAPNTPIVKTDNLKQYICQGNESFDLIAAREYVGAKANLGVALEEFNREFPGAPQTLRERPARLSPGVRVVVPSQEYLLERYARYVPGASQSLPPVSPVANNRSLSNDIGLNPPTPSSKLPAAPTTAAAGTTTYRVPNDNMYFSTVAEQKLGSALRWIDIYRLNPNLQPEQPLRAGTEIRVPVK